MLMNISPPTPVQYEEKAFESVSPSLVEAAFRGTSKKKSPGPDGIGPLATRYIYEWDSDWVVALIGTHIRPGTHPSKRKTATGVTIPKPGKGDYNLAKSCRAIALLNCFG